MMKLINGNIGFQCVYVLFLLNFPSFCIAQKFSYAVVWSHGINKVISQHPDFESRIGYISELGGRLIVKNKEAKFAFEPSLCISYANHYSRIAKDTYVQSENIGIKLIPTVSLNLTKVISAKAGFFLLTPVIINNNINYYQPGIVSGINHEDLDDGFVPNRIQSGPVAAIKFGMGKSKAAGIELVAQYQANSIVASDLYENDYYTFFNDILVFDRKAKVISIFARLLIVIK